MDNTMLNFEESERKPAKVLKVLKEYTKTVKSIEVIDGVETEVKRQVVVGRDVKWETTDPAELAAEQARKAVEEAKAYLAATDYIVLKIAEAQADGDEAAVVALKSEYADRLAKRKEARVTINSNESVLANQTK